MTNYIAKMLHPSDLENVSIPQGETITLFKTYRGIEKYFDGDTIPDMLILRVTAVKKEKDTYQLYNVGNKGFKKSYLKVYDKEQTHPQYGVYVGWMVHL